MRQERASRTRRALLRAAAEEFDRLGYAGASLAGIARAAGISLGALTFHFSSKQELSTAVSEQGCAATRALVARTGARGEPPVQCAVSLTLGLVELLEKDASVRAAARLDREAADAGHGWQGVWAPVIHECLRAAADAEGSPVGDSAALAALAVLLVCGTEATLPRPAGPGSPAGPAGPAGHGGHGGQQGNSALLARIWRQILPQTAQAGCGPGRPPQPRGSHTALHPPSTGTPAPVTNEA